MRNTILIATVFMALPMTAATAQTVTPAPATPSTLQTAPANTMADTAAEQPASAAAVVPTKIAIAEKLAADWPKYDTANKGMLTKVQFNKWMMDLRTAAGQPTPDAQWLAGAFAQTDVNADKKVSSAELTTFLTQGA